MRPALRVGFICGVALLAVVQLSALRPAAAAADPEGDGEWSAPFDLQVEGIHTTLLPTGRVLLFQRPKLSYGSDARVWDPATGAIDDVSFASARDLFCAGHSLLPDGRILVTGGHVHGAGSELGADQTDIFDPATETWTETPALAEARWYPSQVEMADGSTLIFGGWADPQTPATTVESFDPSDALFRELPASASRDVGLYPRTMLLPSGSVFMAGPEQSTQLFDPATDAWTGVGNLNVANRRAGNAVLLPGLTKVLSFGGSPNGVTATAEVIDFADPNPSWRLTSPMHYARKHAAAVLLPDGEVLAVGGGLTGTYGDPVRVPELFDPDTETWTTMASQVAPRMYHSAAVLLPDGRVLSVGQDHNTDYGKTGEIFSPPYLFRGPRPVIQTSPSAVVYGSTFLVRTPDVSRIARVGAHRAGGIHARSVNFSQRFVDVPFVPAGGKSPGDRPAGRKRRPAGVVHALPGGRRRRALAVDVGARRDDPAGVRRTARGHPDLQRALDAAGIGPAGRTGPGGSGRTDRPGALAGRGRADRRSGRSVDEPCFAGRLGPSLAGQPGRRVVRRPPAALPDRAARLVHGVVWPRSLVGPSGQRTFGGSEGRRGQPTTGCQPARGGGGEPGGHGAGHLGRAGERIGRTRDASCQARGPHRPMAAVHGPPETTSA